MVCIPKRTRRRDNPMIGAAKSALNPTSAGGALSSYLVPDEFQIATPNGTYTTPYISAYQSGGVSPYSYEWSVVSGDASLVNTSGNKTKIKLSGYNVIKEGYIKCVVTDDLGATSEVQMYYFVDFG